MESKNNILTKYEKETSINFNMEENLATIYTCSRKVATKCKKAGYILVDEDEFSKTYQCPKNLISFRSMKH